VRAIRPASTVSEMRGGRRLASSDLGLIADQAKAKRQRINARGFHVLSLPITGLRLSFN
jgi:hypothetical protein